MIYTDYMSIAKHKRKNSFKKVPIQKLFKRLLKHSVLFLFAILSVTLIVLISAARSKYNLDMPINIAVVYENHVRILRMDADYEDTIELSLDGDLVMDTSANMGEYSIKNLYKLSQNETKDGVLLKNTLMKNLHIPIFSVLDCRSDASGSVKSSEILSCFKKPNDSSDLIFLIYSRTKSYDNYSRKDIGQYNIVRERSDGTRTIDENISDRFIFDFSRNFVKNDIFNVRLFSDERSNIPVFIKDIIEMSGGRIIGYDTRLIEGVSDCLVETPDKSLNRYFKTVFGCSRSNVIKSEVYNIHFSKEYLDKI